MTTSLQRVLLPALAVLLWLGLSVRLVERAEAKGLGVEPRVGAPGTVVTLQALFPGAPPDHDVTLSLVPQAGPNADCSVVVAEVTPITADGVSPEAWELLGSFTIPDTLTCGSERRPVEPGMYWIEIEGAQFDLPPGADVDLSRVPFGVPGFTAGTLGPGFTSYVVLDASTVSALEARYPGTLLADDGIGQRLTAPLILTLICHTGCYQDPLAGQDMRTVQAFYYRLPDGEGVFSFDPGGPFYELDQRVVQALNASVGPFQPAGPEPSPALLNEPEAKTRDWTPFVIASVAGGLAFALAAFGAGVAVARRGRRPAG